MWIGPGQALVHLLFLKRYRSLSWKLMSSAAPTGQEKPGHRQRFISAILRKSLRRGESRCAPETNWRTGQRPPAMYWSGGGT